MHGAWTEGGANIVKKESVERLEKEGWDKVRPALATTVRYDLWFALVVDILNSCHQRLDYVWLPVYDIREQ